MLKAYENPIIRTDHRRLPAGTPIAEGWKVVDSVDVLEAEIRRRDKELIAEFKYGIANMQPNRTVGRSVIVPWSTVDAILKALPTE